MVIWNKRNRSTVQKHKSKFVLRRLSLLYLFRGIKKKSCAMIKSIRMYINVTYNDFFLFLFQMKPREAYSILATAVLCIGFTIAQDQLFECPRGKFEFPCLFILGILANQYYLLLLSSKLALHGIWWNIQNLFFCAHTNDNYSIVIFLLFSEIYRLLSLRPE